MLILAPGNFNKYFPKLFSYTKNSGSLSSIATRQLTLNIPNYTPRGAGAGAHLATTVSK